VKGSRNSISDQFDLIILHTTELNLILCVFFLLGYAWSGGGRSVVRVDVSADAGKTWQQADLRCGPCNDSGRQWAWTLWSIEVPVPQKSNQVRT